ncbi:MAG: hypothetical protein EOM72_07860 [Opitutae bacterium]|nr:hypothetical protein [Opitutae bacterium]
MKHVFCLLFAAQILFAAPETLPLAEAIAAARVDAGAQVAAHVSATGAMKNFNAFCERSGQPKIYFYNEEGAYTLADGAAIGGVRSVAILKSHGFAKAANRVSDSIGAGQTAGFVVLVFDDKTGGQLIQPDVFECVLAAIDNMSGTFAAPPAKLEIVLAQAKASGRLEIVVVEVP